MPLTKLGRLVKGQKTKTPQEIYLFSLPIKKFEINDYFLGPDDTEKMKFSRSCMPVQKKARADRRIF